MLQSILGRGRVITVSLGLSGALLAGCSGNTTSDNTGGTGGTSATATGGAGGSSGGGLSQAVCDQAAAFMPVDPTAAFDDFEDGNGAVARVGGRDGSWWISTDMTGGTTEPPPDAAPSPEKILGGRCGSKMAMRITGQGFTNWGAVMSAGMHYTTKEESVDLSSFKGLMLWARVGEQNTSEIRAQFQDAQTKPQGGQCKDVSGDPDACYDGFGTTLSPIDTQWRLYKLDFSRMAQRNFGHHGDQLDVTTIYDVEFNFDPNSVFDLWLDDMYFYD